MSGTDDEPVIQFDPEMQRLASLPWFANAVDLATNAANILVEHGVKGTVFAGEGQLSVGDPLGGALLEVASIPRTGLAFLVIKLPDASEMLDYSRAIEVVGERVRKANSDAFVVTMPADWSFRTMTYDAAREFARNMIAFVSDEELEKIGLKRMEL